MAPGLGTSVDGLGGLDVAPPAAQVDSTTLVVALDQQKVDHHHPISTLHSTQPLPTVVHYQFQHDLTFHILPT